MAGLRWSVPLLALALAGCLQASVPPDPAQEAQRAPTIMFLRDDREHRLVVQAVEAGFEWDTLGIKADQAGTMVSAGGADDGPAVELVPAEFRTPSSSPELIYAGDFLRFCGIDGPMGPVEYSIADLQTNTLVFVGTFPDVAAC